MTIARKSFTFVNVGPVTTESPSDFLDAVHTFGVSNHVYRTDF